MNTVLKRVRLPSNRLGGAAGRANNRRKLRESAEARTRDIFDRKAPQLLTSAPGLLVKADEVDELCTALSARSRADETRVGYNYLTEILRNGVETLDWKVEAYPPQVVNLPRAPSPFRPETFARTAILSEIIRRHELVLQDPSVLDFTKLDPVAWQEQDSRKRKEVEVLLPVELRAAQVLFSSIVFGGLLERRLIYSLPAALETRFYTHNDYIWMDFLVPDRSREERPLYRRWFPDPITACLLLRWRIDGERWPSQTSGEIPKLLERYLTRLGLYFETAKSADSPNPGHSAMRVRFTGLDARLFECRPCFARESPFEFLLDAAETRLQINVPSVLVGFARLLRAGASLAPEVWWRTLTDKCIVNGVDDGSQVERHNSSELLDAVEAWPDSPPGDNAEAKGSAQRLLYRRVRDCFRKGNKNLRPAEVQRGLEQVLENHGSEFAPMLMCITAWAIWYLTGRTWGKGRLKVHSVQRYLTSIGGRLIDFGGEMNPKNMSPEEFRSLVDQIASSIQARHERQYARERLSEFHDYLVMSLPIGSLGTDYWGRRNSEISAPDANLITETEFQAILAHLRSFAPDRRTLEMLANVTTVAYRLGLRRDEVAGIQLGSVQGINRTGKLSGQPSIWIRNSVYSSVKSHASVRRLPLSEMMLDAELQQFVEWVKRRYKEDAASSPTSSLLFCALGQPSTKLEDAKSFRLITQAARAVTGDATIRFHHFRHSFITLLSARLLAAAELNWGESALPKTWVAPADLSGPGLLDRIFGSGGPVRKAIYQVAALAGHIDPQETMQTYCHSLDWLLGRFLAYVDWPISLKLLAAVDGRRESAVAVARYRAGGRTRKLEMADVRRSVSRLIRKAKTSNRAVFAIPPESTLRTSPRPNQEMLAERKITELTLVQAYALALSSKRSMSTTACAELFDMSSADVSKFLSEAKQVASELTATRVRHSRRSRTLRHEHLRHRMPRSTRRPEISGLGPALPKVSVELTEGCRVFKRLVETPERDIPAVRKQLECLIRVGSRTESELYVTAESDLALLGALFKYAGLRASRIKIRVLSVPKGDMSLSDFRKQVAKLGQIGARSVMFDKGSRTSRSGRSTFGSLRISIKEAGASSAKHGDRAAYGWKIACFYALVVLRVVMKPGSQMEMF